MNLGKSASPFSRNIPAANISYVDPRTKIFDCMLIFSFLKSKFLLLLKTKSGSYNGERVEHYAIGRSKKSSNRRLNYAFRLIYYDIVFSLV